MEMKLTFSLFGVLVWAKTFGLSKGSPRVSNNPTSNGLCMTLPFGVKYFGVSCNVRPLAIGEGVYFFVDNPLGVRKPPGVYCRLPGVVP